MGVQPPHTPPPPRILKIVLNVKEKRYKKRENYMKVRDRGLRVLQRSSDYFFLGGGGLKFFREWIILFLYIGLRFIRRC